MKLMRIIKKIFNVLIDGFKRSDPITYAKNLGVEVGKECRFVDNPSWGSEPWLISIGNHVLISGQVTFLNHDGATFLFRENGPYKDTYKFGPIKVGDNCFIGAKAIILPNVTIGDNCIVAAGSVVTKNVPSGEVWGGIPAHYIKKTEDYAKQCFENRLPYDVEELKTNKKKEMLRVVNLANDNVDNTLIFQTQNENNPLF